MEFKGRQLQQLREGAKLSRAKMARKLQAIGWDKDVSAIYRWEKRGNVPNSEDLLLLARVLEVDTGALPLFFGKVSTSANDTKTEAA